MLSDARPLRSMLYIPGSKPRAIDKARGLPTDAIIFDLEDAVAPDEKDGARQTLTDELATGGFGRRLRLVRINALDTPWGMADATAAAAMDCDGVLLPKVGDPEAVAALRGVVGGRPVWAMVETPEAILNAAAIARAPGLGGFVLGTNDLAKEIGCATGGDRMALMTALQIALLAARAARVPCLDGVYNAYKDDAGLTAECAQGAALGMDGKTLIHPAQIAIANAAFSPAEADVDLARRQIDAYDAAIARGEAVAVVDGRIVENLHVETARATLAKAHAIREMEAA